jgi:hypothetical protein
LTTASTASATRLLTRIWLVGVAQPIACCKHRQEATNVRRPPSEPAAKSAKPADFAESGAAKPAADRHEAGEDKAPGTPAPDFADEEDEVFALDEETIEKFMLDLSNLRDTDKRDKLAARLQEGLDDIAVRKMENISEAYDRHGKERAKRQRLLGKERKAWIACNASMPPICGPCGETSAGQVLRKLGDIGEFLRHEREHLEAATSGGRHPIYAHVWGMLNSDSKDGYWQNVKESIRLAVKLLGDMERGPAKQEGDAVSGDTDRHEVPAPVTPTPIDARDEVGRALDSRLATSKPERNAVPDGDRASPAAQDAKRGEWIQGNRRLR